MKEYFETIETVDEYRKLFDNMFERFECVQQMIREEPDQDKRQELTGALVSGYMSLFSNLQTLFGDMVTDSFYSDAEMLNQLVGEPDIEEVLNTVSGINTRWRIGVLSICHDITCEAARKVTEAEIQTEIQEVLDLIGNEVVLSGKYDPDYQEETEYMRKHNRVYVFPYHFTDKYDASDIKVFSEEDSEYKYVIHQGKKLYFPNWDDEAIQREYNQLLLEQDPESPHRYFDEECSFGEGDIFVDLGAAEGIMSLSIIERASEVFLIESTDYWIKSLNKTFSAYKDKVHIIPKYAGANDDEDTVTIDTVLSDYSDKNIYIKMDIEGMEPEALLGARRTLENNNCHVSCAVYHTNDEFSEVAGFLDKHGYRSYTSDKYMLFIYSYSLFENGKYERPTAPYFRKGVLRGIKDSEQ